MSDVKMNDLKRHDKVYFARIMPRLDYYEIHECSVATMHSDDYCTVCDVKTKQSFLMHKPRAEEVLFHDRKLALNYLKEQKKINKNVKIYRKDEDVEGDTHG